MPVIDDARAVADVIKKVGRPEAVILFGSVARVSKGNDIDLLVVGNRTDQKRVMKSLRPFYNKYPIDTFFVSRRKLRELYYNGSPFLRLIQREGRLLYMQNSLKDWHDSGLEDLRQAEYLLEGGFHRGVCFSSQQAAEKLIKWALLKKGWDLEKIHSIRRLTALAGDFGIRLPLHDEDMDFLDSIYRGRYPGEEGLLPLGSPTQKDAKKALQIAKKIAKEFK